MRDPRVERLAALLVDYSLELREGHVLRIDSPDCAAPLVAAIYRTALARGALPYANVDLSGLAEILIREGSDEQLEYLSPIEWAEVDAVDAMATVWADDNTRALSNADPDRQSLRSATRRRLSNRRWERITAGEMSWVGTLFPTHAHAQDADMSLPDYERFVFNACRVEEDGDAALAWRATASELAARAEELGATRELRVLGPDTDLTLGVAGREWIVADGRFNMPDGEVFTSPIETSTVGDVRFRLPAVFEGREVEDVRLRFEGGAVVAAEAARGQEYLRSLLEIEGARVLGEAAFGLNYAIDRFTYNILFDEKIGGTMHFALGSSFAQAGGQNPSNLHWDMICDLRSEGEVYADGELVWKAGRFLSEVAGG